jgi:DNA mismatch endonuclease (patch repair protein)
MKYSRAYRAAIRKGVNTPSNLRRLSHAHANQSIKQTHPEKALHSALDKRTWRFVGSPRLHDGSPNPSGVGQDLPVSADIVSRSKRIMIFVDGCYWHECPLHGRGRFPGAAARDQLKAATAEEANWIVLRFWEHEVKGDLDSVIQEIAAA